MTRIVMTSLACALLTTQLLSQGQPGAQAPQIETKKVEGTDNVYTFRNQNSQAMFIVTSEGVIATDPVVYGSVMDEIATKLGIPVTYAVGVPVERSRPGRAAMAYLEWISADFPESMFRYLLASGDVAPTAGGDDAPSGGRLARRLRRLRVGWGRDRYREAIDLRLHRLEIERREDPEPDPEDGPVAVEIGYRIRHGDSAGFLDLLSQLRAPRRRDGATFWRIYRDLADPSRYVERFIVASWADYLHQRARATRAALCTKCDAQMCRFCCSVCSARTHSGGAIT